MGRYVLAAEMRSFSSTRTHTHTTTQITGSCSFLCCLRNCFFFLDGNGGRLYFFYYLTIQRHVFYWGTRRNSFCVGGAMLYPGQMLGQISLFKISIISKKKNKFILPKKRSKRSFIIFRKARGLFSAITFFFKCVI